MCSLIRRLEDGVCLLQLFGYGCFLRLVRLASPVEERLPCLCRGQMRMLRSLSVRSSDFELSLTYAGMYASQTIKAIFIRVSVGR